MNPIWHGGLTIENAEEVGNIIYKTLKGKKYCFVSQNYSSPEETATRVRVNQHLENGKNGSSFDFWIDEEGSFAGFNFCDTYGVWGATTTFHDKEMICGWDSTYHAPYIVIEHHQVKIIQLNGHNDVICWVIAIQE